MNIELSPLGQVLKMNEKRELLELKKKKIANWFKTLGQEVPNLDHVRLSDTESVEDDSDISEGGLPTQDLVYVVENGLADRIERRRE